MKKTDREQIELMEYRTIERGFYEVFVHGRYKIIAEGNVCGGILVELMEKTKQDKGKIVKIKGKTSFINQDMREEIKSLTRENKSLRIKISSIKKSLT